MTFESRAEGAALDIHRAVEVMELTTSTKERQKIERFDHFRDLKQRNRRIGAILLAGALVVAAIVVASASMLDRGKGVVLGPSGAPEGRILYEVDAGGNTTALFTIDAAGGASEDLGVDTAPGARWSPDGTRILVTSTVTSTAGPAGTAHPIIRPATIAADGSDFRLLDGFEDRSANLKCTAFSRDGSLLGCEGEGGDLWGGVFTVRSSDGSMVRELTNFVGLPGGFSPDDEEVVFFGPDDSDGSSSSRDSSLKHAGTLYVVGTDGSGLRAITPPSTVLGHSFASWSPDGDWIVFIDAEGHLSLVRPDGSERHAIPFAHASIREATAGATWSPDGGWIAFTAREVGADNPDLYLVRPDGTEIQQVTDTPNVAESTPDWTVSDEESDA